jgi:DNA polymerase III epsilon subunit-like protein
MTFEILKTAKRVLVYDTETTGLPKFQSPSSDPSQPHLTDICAILYSMEGELIEVFEQLIQPKGWEVEPEAAALTGLTTEFLTINGGDEKQAVATFGQMHKKADLRVAHNIGFDDRIMRIAIKRYFGDAPADRFKAAPIYCTANASKPIVKCPPTAKMQASRFRNQFKTPNMQEALSFFCPGEVIGGAHRARPDAEACAKVFFALMARSGQ